MKCKLFNCTNEVKGNYPCCSQDHGVEMKLHLRQLQDCFNANFSMREWGTRELYTVKMAEHYDLA